MDLRYLPHLPISSIEFEEDNGDGTTMWRVDDPHAPGTVALRLDHRHVVQYGLVDKMREGLERVAREGISEPQEQPREATDGPTKADVRPVHSSVLGGHAEGWQWHRVNDTYPCPMDTDGDGACHVCTTGRSVEGCEKGKITDVLWAIDNRPAVDAYWNENPNPNWKTGNPVLRSARPPELQQVVLPDWLVKAIFSS